MECYVTPEEFHEIYKLSGDCHMFTISPYGTLFDEILWLKGIQAIIGEIPFPLPTEYPVKLVVLKNCCIFERWKLD